LENKLAELEVGIEEAILTIGIVIGLADFFSLLPPEIEYLKALVSWGSLGYLIYKASITKILFGERHKRMDVAILLCYFLFFTKDLVGFILSAIRHASTTLLPFYKHVLENAVMYEKASFVIGGTALIIIAIWTVKLPIRKPSVMNLIHEEETPKTARQKTVRFLSIYLLLIMTFIAFFNLAMEWLTISADSPLLLILVLFYFFFVLKHHKKFHPSTFIHKVGNTSEEFYEHTINMFSKKETVFLAISGLLVLHVLTDAAHFLVPYITTMKSEFYFSQLGIGHEHLWMVAARDWAALDGAAKITSPLIYLSNTIAACLIFLTPGYIWYKISKKQQTHLEKIAPLFYATLAVFLILPILKIKIYSGKNLVGVDILTQQIQFPQNIIFMIGIATLIGAAFYLLSKRFPQRVDRLTTIIILTYMSYYILLFFLDSYAYYIASIISLLKHAEIFLGLHLFMFFALLIIFYIGGLMVLIAETLWPAPATTPKTKEQIRKELLYYIPPPTQTRTKRRNKNGTPKKNGK
jgi:hypothetical protein